MIWVWLLVCLVGFGVDLLGRELDDDRLSFVGVFLMGLAVGAVWW